MICCVEDDENIRELIVYTLISTGLPAKGFNDGKELFSFIKDGNTPDLVLLDIMLPGEDGIQILKRIRSDAKVKNVPVIMVTAKGAEYEKVQALDIGADDYVTKPFGMMELVSRIKAVMRRSIRDDDDQILTIGGITMDLMRHKVTVDGEEVILTLKEYKLLKKLMLNNEVVLTRDQLLSDIWGYESDVETRTVDVHVRTLRQKLGKCADLIETVRGVGYRINDSE